MPAAAMITEEQEEGVLPFSCEPGTMLRGSLSLSQHHGQGPGLWVAELILNSESATHSFVP